MTDLQKKDLKKKFKRGLVLSAIIMIASVVLEIVWGLVLTFLENRFQFDSQLWKKNIFNSTWILVFLVGGVAISIFFIFSQLLKGNLKIKVMKENEDLEDAHFISHEEMEQSPTFQLGTWEDLPNMKDGVPINAKYWKSEDKFKLVLAERQHTLVLGATGTGKTTTFMFPAIHILSRCKTQPTMIITDPKGELYANTVEQLRKRGYNVKLLNLAKPLQSNHYNPLSYVIKKIEEYIEIVKKPIKQVPNSLKYSFDDHEYSDLLSAEKMKRGKMQTTAQMIKNDTEDIFATLFQIEDKNQPTWQKSAKDFLLGCMLQMIEFAKRGKMPPNCVTFRNLFLMVDQHLNSLHAPKDEKPEDTKSLLRRFLTLELPDFKEGASNAGTVLQSKDNTLDSYLGHVRDYINFFSDLGIQALTSSDDMEIYEIDERPTAIFVQFEIVKESRINTLVSILISQMYKTLNVKAHQNQFRKDGKATREEKLLRSVYFLIDEFGNIPKITSIERMVTYGRGIGLCVVPVVQNYSQLTAIYGESGAKTIRSNCKCNIYIGTNEQSTLEELSKSLGQQKVSSQNISSGNDISSSYSAQSKPLMYPSELGLLNDGTTKIGHVIIQVAGISPYRGFFDPVFRPHVEKYYGKLVAYREEMVDRPLDEEANYWTLDDYFDNPENSKNNVENLENEVMNYQSQHGQPAPAPLKEDAHTQNYKAMRKALLNYNRTWYPKDKAERLLEVPYEDQLAFLIKYYNDSKLKGDIGELVQREYVLNALMGIHYDFLKNEKARQVQGLTRDTYILREREQRNIT